MDINKSFDHFIISNQLTHLGRYSIELLEKAYIQGVTDLEFELLESLADQGIEAGIRPGV